MFVHASERAIGAHLQQVISQHTIGGAQHRAHSWEVLDRGQHAERLRALTREQERHRRVVHRRAGDGSLGRWGRDMDEIYVSR